MKVYKTCSIQDCTNPAKMICKCTEKGEIFCFPHVEWHLEENLGLKHEIEALWIKITPNQINSLLNKKQDLLKEKNEAIQSVMQKASLEYIKLHDQAEFIKEITRQTIFDIELQYSTLLDKLEVYLAELAIRTDGEHKNEFLALIDNPVKIEIKKEFSIEDLIFSKLDGYESFLYFFKKESKEFCKLSLKDLKITSNIVEVPENRGLDSSCWVDEESILFVGSEFSNFKFRIEVYKRIVYSIPNNSDFVASRLAVVKHKGNFYCFGGKWERKECFMLDGIEKNWKKIRDLPVGSNYNSAVSIGKYILVAGYYMECLLRYSEEEDKFDEILKLVTNQEKQLIVTPFGVVICLCKSNGIYISRAEDLTNWTKVGECSINPEPISVSGIFTDWIY